MITNHVDVGSDCLRNSSPSSPPGLRCKPCTFNTSNKILAIDLLRTNAQSSWHEGIFDHMYVAFSFESTSASHALPNWSNTELF